MSEYPSTDPMSVVSSDLSPAKRIEGEDRVERLGEPCPCQRLGDGEDARENTGEATATGASESVNAGRVAKGTIGGREKTETKGETSLGLSSSAKASEMVAKR